ncbi:MAG: DUF3267 domain-containing protein [Lachnospiraceae bacterium]|nr:DUF3267 domain-containing protein [Lachnospiraceae bacterium]
MHLTFKKEFDGDMEKLPKREVPGSHQFKEFGDLKKLSLVANALAIGIFIVLMIPAGKVFLSHFDRFEIGLWKLLILLVAEILVIPVHEFLHATMFKGDVQFYTYLKKGLAFVVGDESMTKGRFVLMSLLPNIVLGLVPYILFFFFPQEILLAMFAAGNLAAGAGDYINVYHALTQMPKGSLTYMSGIHSYWYMPGETGESE